MNRINISSGSPWEDSFGYSRAVKINNNVYVSGTTAFNEEGTITGVNDMYQQTKQVYKNIAQALHEAKSSLDKVIRVRICVTDISQWQEVGRAHHELFKNIKPAATLVEVTKLLTSEMLVEIEVDAYV